MFILKSKSNFISIIAFFIFLALQACGSKITEEEKNKALVLQYYEAINLGRADFAETLISDNFVKYNNDTNSEKRGPLVFIESIENHQQNNIDYLFLVEDIIAEKNKVSVRWTWKSTNIRYVQPTEIISQGISIFEIEKGKITKLWQGFDVLGFNKQLGFKFKSPLEIEKVN